MFLDHGGQGFDDVFDALPWREKAEGQDDLSPLDAELVLEEVGVDERQVGDAVVDEGYLAVGDAIDLAQELRALLAHDDEAVGELGDFFHDRPLAFLGIAQDGV